MSVMPAAQAMLAGRLPKLTANFRNLPVQTIFDSGDTVPP
jgi:hypothetical protein